MAEVGGKVILCQVFRKSFASLSKKKRGLGASAKAFSFIQLVAWGCL